MTRNATKFSLVGPGRVGTSVALALARQGWVCRSIVSKPSSRREQQLLNRKFPGTKILTSPVDLLPDFDVLFVAVRDDEVPCAISQLSEAVQVNWKGKTVFHFSGIVPLDALTALHELGASVGALHPISPFAQKYSPDFSRSIYYDFLGTPKALRCAREIVKGLRSKLLVLHSEKERAMLHVASVIASNTVVIAVKSAEEMISNFIERGDAKSLLSNLLTSTAENISTKNGMSALTGPLVRGDFNIIESHMRVLRGKNRILDYYKSASLLGIEELLKHESRGPRRTALNRIKKLLEVE